MKRLVPLVLLAVGALVGCSEIQQPAGSSPQNDHNVLTGGPFSGTRLDELPEAVRSALNRRAPHAEIADIDKITRDGKEIYEISFSEAGRNPKIYITPSGEVITNPDLPSEKND